MSVDLRGLPSALFGSGIAERNTVTGWDAAISGSLSNTRRIGFVSLAAGAGATTLAHQVTRIVASRRPGRVLAVDVSGNPRGLGHRLGVRPTAPNESRARARSTAEAVTELEGRDGWFALRPGNGGADAAPVDPWLTEAAPITRFFDVSITDFGVRHPLVDLGACAALCDVVCIVSDASRSAAELARAVAPAIAALPERPRAVLALVDHAHAGDAVARAIDADGVPYDHGLRAAADPRSIAAQRALMRLTATLVAASDPEVGR